MTRSEQINVFGLKILTGLNIKNAISEKKAIVFKLYAGLSTRYKINKNKNGTNIMEDGTIVPLQIEQRTAFLPAAIHLGVKIGISNLIKTTK